MVTLHDFWCSCYIVAGLLRVRLDGRFAGRVHVAHTVVASLHLGHLDRSGEIYGFLMQIALTGFIYKNSGASAPYLHIIK